MSTTTTINILKVSEYIRIEVEKREYPTHVRHRTRKRTAHRKRTALCSIVRIFLLRCGFCAVARRRRLRRVFYHCLARTLRAAAALAIVRQIRIDTAGVCSRNLSGINSRASRSGPDDRQWSMRCLPLAAHNNQQQMQVVPIRERFFIN